MHTIRINPIICILILMLVVINIGCKKFVTVEAPPTSLSSQNVFLNDGTAAAVMTHTYVTLSDDQYKLIGSSLTATYLFGGLLADELTLYNLNDDARSPYYRNSLSKNDQPGPWDGLYKRIFIANSVIEGVAGNTNLTPSVAKQLLGEAKFLRAFCYFYLVNFYGKVPLVTTTDAKISAVLERANIDNLYNLIIDDLKSAQELLSDRYLAGDIVTVTTEKVRPTKWAASALLARVYLYHNDYKNAFLESSKLISSNRFKLSELSNTFLQNSDEAIWQLQTIYKSKYANTGEGYTFILPTNGPSNSYPVYLGNALLDNFEENDQRKAKWIDSVLIGSKVYYYPAKYKSGQLQNSVITEYEMVFRLGEQYLIRAEAEANGAGGGLADAVADLNVIRKRAGLKDYSRPVIRDTIMSALLHERQVELFTEWGHRWFDLKRWPSNMLSRIMTPAALIKGSVWNPDDHQALYPIPQLEIERNRNLDQNPGY